MHLELVCYGSPIKHKKFIEDINNWEYPIESNIRKGIHRPFVSEVKVYDVRIKEELAPQFLRDIDARQFLGMDDHKGNKGFKKIRSFFISFLIKMLRKAMGHVEVEHAEGPKVFSLPDWFYAFSIVNLKDPLQEDPITKEMKEVL